MNKRDMFYSNYNQGGYIEPNMNPYMMPNMNPNIPNMIPNTYPSNDVNNNALYDFEMRLGKIERQINNLDSRITKLELAHQGKDEITNNYIL